MVVPFSTSIDLLLIDNLIILPPHSIYLKYTIV
jgi:hypothetical protein